MTSQVTSDQIREFVNETYIRPARSAGQTTVTIRAGDVHSQMGLKERMPQVCGAIGADKFQTEYRVTLLSQDGPHNGANKRFTFQV